MKKESGKMASKKKWLNIKIQFSKHPFLTHQITLIFGSYLLTLVTLLYK